MLERVKVWFRKHSKAVLITATILAVTGAFAVLLIDGKIVKIPVKELAEKLVPEVPQKSSESLAKAADKLAPKVAETVAVEVNGTLKSFPRAEFIRQLHEGWSASAAKTAQAAAKGIDLKPGETFVNACTVTMRR